MTGTQVETLASVPSLRRLYARAALTARGRGGPLPQTTLRVESLVVDRSRLLRYQRLCGFAVGDVLPHTFPYLLGFPLQVELMARRSFPLALPGLVHVENSITLHRTLLAGDTPDVSVRAEALREHPKGMLVDLLTDLEVAGEPVWSSRSTYLRRGEPHPQAARPAPSPGLPSGGPSAIWRLPEGLGRDYAAVSGDVNPIHLHAATARAMGLRRPIAHGMWTYARTLAVLGPRTSGPSTSRVWFRQTVPLPTTVALTVERTQDQVVAGLRGSRDAGTEHLVLTWRPQG